LIDVRLLALADWPFHADPATLAAQHDVSAVVCLGDLQPSWIESLERVRLPKLGVYGNHDHDPYMHRFGIDDMHLRRVELDHGPSITGFQGCVTYPGRRGEAGSSYNQHQAWRLMRRLPRADILLCHCPPSGVNDDPCDPAHHGFAALRHWVLEHRPRLLPHGHTHPHPGALQTRLGDTRVVHVSAARIIDLA
jgi:Icc-related predicted phosphoesterase